ncbi:hypothetical protein ACIQF6_19710 [Kitasatospora sp. NPDC092948]|uniref:hypothetical protein n=1 Tax=Kitasatospora sp. NPDC092948 TaxID=3364088 RepID=UPI003816F975
MQVPDWLAPVAIGAAGVVTVLRLALRKWIPWLTGDFIVSLRAVRELRAELRDGQEPARPALPDKNDQAAA